MFCIQRPIHQLPGAKGLLDGVTVKFFVKTASKDRIFNQCVSNSDICLPHCKIIKIVHHVLKNSANYSTFLTRTALVQTRANHVLNIRPKYSTCTKSIHYFSTCTIVLST